jgi:hypothetical protein
LNVYIVADMVNIDQYLSNIAYAGYSAVPMLPTPESKVGYGINFKEVGTGHLKEVSQQFIGSPLVHQSGKVIEDITDPSTAFLNYSVYLTTEIVKPRTRVNSGNCQTGSWFKHRSVWSKAQVNTIKAIPDRLLSERSGKVWIVIEAVNLPDHVITWAQPLQELIQGCEPASNRL